MREPRAPEPPLWDDVVLRTQWTLAAASLALCALMAYAYAVRPPGWAALTQYPAGFWIFPGLVLCAFSHSRRRTLRTAITLVAWLVFVLVLAEEPRALWTAFRPWPDPAWVVARQDGQGLRVVGLNCKARRAASVEEALTYEPDVVLLQEAPTAEVLDEVAARHPGYEALTRGELAIVSRGHLTSVPVDPPLEDFVLAADLVAAGRRLIVASVHFSVPFRGMDFWRAETRHEARLVWEDHHRQVELLAQWVRTLDPATPLIVGGDMNTAAGDSLLRDMPARLADTFRIAGIGWGNTVRNRKPFLRVDYIWADTRLRPVTVVARRTEHSDHRAVVADLVWAQ
ncbi:MAG TPA: endonuclease/exonuclease/phosphatase family protein [Armatimonadota bacterium]|nr:endonuclease/exonuclease/phosphatase family protein [Armatimonadota bacterium]